MPREPRVGKQLTVRGIPPELARLLEERARERRSSVNAVVLQLLGDALSTGNRLQRLGRYLGWAKQEAERRDAGPPADDASRAG